MHVLVVRIAPVNLAPVAALIGMVIPAFVIVARPVVLVLVVTLVIRFSKTIPEERSELP